MTNNTLELPQEYTEFFKIDLQKNKKTAIWVNLLSAVIAVGMIMLGCAFVPLSALFNMESGLGMYFLRWCLIFAGLVVYMVLHELVHGVFMKRYSGIKAKYGFTGLYAYAGSLAYFNKPCYLIIALAPVVVWGVVLAVLTFIVPPVWFWMVYMIQVINISGAAGDFYVTYKMLKMPQDILVQDTGVAMTIYAPENVHATNG